MKLVFETLLTTKIEKARTLGEALEIANKFIVSYPASRESITPEYIWRHILYHFNFNPSDWNLPNYHGFFEIRDIKRAPYDSWSYYLVYNTREDVRFKDNQENLVLSFMGAYYLSTSNYLLIYIHKDKKCLIYYKDLKHLIAFPLFEYPPDDIYETSIGLVIKVDDEEDIVFYLFEEKESAFKILETHTPESFIGIGFYGFYERDENSLFMNPFNSQSTELVKSIPYISGKEAPSIRTIHRTIESMHDNYENVATALYDSRDRKITWVNLNRDHLNIFETFAIIENKVVDIITGDVFYADKPGTEIYLSRKENNTGYYIWTMRKKKTKGSRV